MEQDSENQSSNQPIFKSNSKGVRPFWVFVAIFLTAIIVGVGVYFWQGKVNNHLVNELQSRIDSIVDRVNFFVKTKEVKIVVQSKEEKGFPSQNYRNEVYGFEIKYPEQWSLKDTLPKIKKDTLAIENVEFFNNPFPTSMTKFVFWPNPTGFGVEYCNVSYSISSDGLKVVSVKKGEDQCSPEYKNSHLDEVAVVDRCSDGIRYACFRIEGTNNNHYLGYLQSDATGEHAMSESEADALLQRILSSFKAF